MNKTTAIKMYKFIQKKFNLIDYDFDIFAIKKLAETNTLGEKSGNQTHIALTGKQVDIFPYLDNIEYLVNGDKNFKKRFLLNIPIKLSQNNLNYLDNNLNDLNTDSYISSYTHFNRSKRTDGSFQGELSFLKGDDHLFLENFRKKINTFDYLIIIKERSKFDYLFIALKNEDALQMITEVDDSTINTASDVYFDDTNPGTNKNITLVNTNDIPKNLKLPKDNNLEKNNEINEENFLWSNNALPNFPKQRILYGAPGTGKSFKLNEEAQTKFAKDNINRVTFYDSYTYNQFVGTYKPVTNVNNNGGTEISYEFVGGPLLKSLIKAFKNQTSPVLLIIEEINRAKPDRVFGDIFQLLDRKDTGESEYTISLSKELKKYLEEELGSTYQSLIGNKGLYFPKNLYIWATMNSADQGVYHMDTAFKRRWDFEYLSLNEKESQLNSEFKVKAGDKIYNWNDYRKHLNNFLSKKGITEDRLIAPFFINKNSFIDNLLDSKVFANKLLMYIFDDILKHHQRLKEEIFISKNIFEIMEQLKGDKNIHNNSYLDGLVEIIESTPVED